MNKNTQQWLALLFFISLLNPALVSACKFAPDTRTLQQKIQAAAVAFVGKVESVDSSKVTFSVITSLKKPLEKTFTLSPGHTSCHIRFTPDQEWLYLGDEVMSGSVLLSSEWVLKILPNEDLKKEPAIQKKWNPAWTQCRTQSDCRELYYGCNGRVAVRNDQFAEIQKIIYSVKADPRVVNCEISRKSNPMDLRELPNAHCQNNQCVLLELSKPEPKTYSK